MARRYSVPANGTNTANVTLVNITGGTTIRPKIYDVMVGSEATPADQAARYTLNRTTTAGTGAAITTTALEAADPASVITAIGQAITGEPAYTASAILLQFPLNQRATFRWVAAPGSELVIPATSANGAGLRATSVTTSFAVSTETLVEE